MIVAADLAINSLVHSIGRDLRVRNIWFKAVQGTLTIASGIRVGCVVTLTSVCSSVIAVFSYLYLLRMTLSCIIVTDPAHDIPLALFAGLGLVLLDNVYLKLPCNILFDAVGVSSEAFDHQAIRNPIDTRKTSAGLFA